MGEGLKHHYEANRHHPGHFDDGVNGMTLVDVIEMLADWKAATERRADGDLAKSLEIQRERFSLCDQLVGDPPEHSGALRVARCAELTSNQELREPWPTSSVTSPSRSLIMRPALLPIAVAGWANVSGLDPLLPPV
jgi:Family of unknown function (DUF5662)